MRDDPVIEFARTLSLIGLLSTLYVFGLLLLGRYELVGNSTQVIVASGIIALLVIIFKGGTK